MTKTSQITVKLSVRWWFRYYVFAVLFWAAIGGRAIVCDWVLDRAIKTEVAL